jgi:hypothetical protein
LVFLAAPPGCPWPPPFGRFLRQALRLLSSEATKQLPVNQVVCVHSFEAPSAPTIGYPEVAGTFVVKNPFKGAESLVTDAFASYAWKNKLLGKTTNWLVSLRVRNLLNHDETFPNSAVDNGTGTPHYLQRIYVQPRTYEFTASMKF